VSFLDDDAVQRLRAALGPPDLAGTRYELLGTLGRGGMGTVYRVRDAELQREVALKVLDVDDDERLPGEARVAAQLEHPGIVPVHDLGRLPDGRLYFTMKLVRGERLDRWATAARSRAERLAVVQRLCETAAFAHAHGVVHRDLKPENIMVGTFGEVLVMDWGVAQLRGDSGTVAGTRGFMAPEQARGEEVDARADVHALGALLRCLTPDAPAPLRAIAARATAESPPDRYPGALELSADIARFLAGEAVQAHREGPLERVARVAARHRVALLLIAGYLLVRVALVIASRR
jgi:eukaryotic-like serine/threonine-protein kinase